MRVFVATFGLCLLALVGLATQAHAQWKDPSARDSCTTEACKEFFDVWAAGMERGQDTFTCPSDWSGNCGYSGKGQFKVCAPEGNQICGYTAKVLSRKNGRYGMYPIDKNCVSGAISSKGSGNPADRWGGTMVVQITTYSYLVGQPPKQVAIDKYCKIERDGNPPQGGCGCVGPVMMCNGQASGVCSTTISTP